MREKELIKSYHLTGLLKADLATGEGPGSSTDGRETV